MGLTRRHLLGAGGAFAATALAAPASARAPRGLRVMERREVIPDVAFKDAAGTDIGFVEMRGRPIVAAFWATWCTVCYGEMPKLDALQRSLAGKATVAALSIDRAGIPAVQDYFARRRLTALTPYLDPERIFASIMGIRGVPTAFVLDSEGRIAAVAEGPADWDSPEMRRYLLSLA